MCVWLNTMAKRTRHAEWSSPPGSAPPVAERLPARTLLYRSMARTRLVADGEGSSMLPLPEPGEVFTLAAPATAVAGVRVCEYMLQRALAVVRCEEPATAESMCQLLRCEGWRSADGDLVSLLEPAAVLVLADDDKQVGLAQATLPDMFFRRSLRPP